MVTGNAQIKDYLEKEGLKHSSLGFRYLVLIISIVGKDPDKNTVLSEVYKIIATEYDASPKSIDRSIRYSIKHQDVTNKEFIMKAVDELFADHEARGGASGKQKAYRGGIRNSLVS
ncbi:Forkhead domain-containing protein [Sporobacter termitidis DSM 10068]|uniref:Forkhead domain-containing protein n=1 Tax=Sporobacter termitidis DSM 10068 TaxID=1123282 RepID=A0A1M5Z414_9FIRM|nr:sporulation initiation factor Spo0A C-terminal domain-containing protein [Sporobacter termitidis]SHI19007.1 Forkhead domain-containing protein [Sporobacter termitidis DSM 10068]